MQNLVCPVSTERVNEKVVRVTAAFVATLVIIYAFTLNVFLIVFLMLDFFIRAFTQLKYSPLSWIAVQIVSVLKLPAVVIDKAPKIFAARVGFLFTLIIIGLFFINQTASIVVGVILVAFALLEAVFNVCVGCIVYTYLVLPFFSKNSKTTLS